MREIGFRPDSRGGMGEYMIVEEKYIHKIPDDWSYELGAWVETFSIGYFGIWGNGGYIDASDTCVVFGCGPVGLSAWAMIRWLHVRGITIRIGANSISLMTGLLRATSVRTILRARAEVPCPVA